MHPRWYWFAAGALAMYVFGRYAMKRVSDAQAKFGSTGDEVYSRRAGIAEG